MRVRELERNDEHMSKVGGNLAAGISQLNSPSTIRPVAWAVLSPYFRPSDVICHGHVIIFDLARHVGAARPPRTQGILYG
jgi:hypothetical protein